MRIQINGEQREFDGQSRLSDLIETLSLSPERIAIELNQRVVRRTEWPEVVLKEGDRLEIIHFVGGGSQPISHQPSVVGHQP